MAATCAEMAEGEVERLAVAAGTGCARGERKARSARRLVERRESSTRRLSSAGEQRHARRRPTRREDATFRDTDPIARRRRHCPRAPGKDFAGAAGGWDLASALGARGFGFAAFVSECVIVRASALACFVLARELGTGRDGEREWRLGECASWGKRQ